MRILRLLTMLLGLLGLAGCFAAIVGGWIVSSRLSQATDKVFGTIDSSLVVVRERITQTQDRVEASKITTESIEKTLKDWAKKEAGERLALRLNATEKTERLSVTLEP